MMKNEFEQLAGYEVTWEDYTNIIEPMYMALPENITKQDFVQMVDKTRFALKPLDKIEKEMKEIAEQLKETCTHYTDYDTEGNLEELVKEYANRLGVDGYQIYNRQKWSCYYPYKVVIYTKNYYTVREIELCK